MVHHTESITESQRQPVTVLPLCFFFVSSSIRASWASSQDPKERHIDRRGRHTMMLDFSVEAWLWTSGRLLWASSPRWTDLQGSQPALEAPSLPLPCPWASEGAL
jgi:hypothetical protein